MHVYPTIVLFGVTGRGISGSVDIGLTWGVWTPQDYPGKSFTVSGSLAAILGKAAKVTEWPMFKIDNHQWNWVSQVKRLNLFFGTSLTDFGFAVGVNPLLSLGVAPLELGTEPQIFDFGWSFVQTLRRDPQGSLFSFPAPPIARDLAAALLRGPQGNQQAAMDNLNRAGHHLHVAASEWMEGNDGAV